MKSILGLRGRRMALAAVATFVVAGGIAFAAIPDAGTGVYHACMKKNGTIRIIDPAQEHCKPSNEVEITFNGRGRRATRARKGRPGRRAGRRGRRGWRGRHAVLGHVHEPERPVLDQRHRHRDRAREPGLLDPCRQHPDQGRDDGQRPDRGAKRHRSRSAQRPRPRSQGWQHRQRAEQRPAQRSRRRGSQPQRQHREHQRSGLRVRRSAGDLIAGSGGGTAPVTGTIVTGSATVCIGG